MKVNYEEPLDYVEDVLRLKRNFYVPKGTFWTTHFKYSPFPTWNKIHEQIVEKDLYFFYDETGNHPIEFEKEVIK